MNDLLDQTTTSGASPQSEALPFTPFLPDFIDSSMLATFKSCPQLFKKLYVDHWKPKESNVHLHAGGAFAKGLEVARRAFFSGEHTWWKRIQVDLGDPSKGTKLTNVTEYLEPGDSDSSIACGLQALLTFYGDFDCPSDSAKSAERTAGAFEFYFDNYPLAEGDGSPIILPGSGKLGIEFSFAHPVPVLHPDTGNPFLVVGRMDMLMNAFGGVFIEDDKTTTSLGASWSRQWDLRGQFTQYAWGCRESGIKVDGAVIRGVSILKTKYETQQVISYRPEWQIERWYEELLLWLEDIVICYKTGRWRHNLDHACGDWGGCTFREVCSSSDERPWLETKFERRLWNPLLREEKKL